MGGRAAPRREQPGDGAFGHLDAEVEELGMDPRGTPEWIRGGHAADQSFDLGVDGWATSGGPAGEFRPVLAEAPPLPPQDGVRRHDREGRSPASGQADPEEVVNLA